jgi:hypothetical protein
MTLPLTHSLTSQALALVEPQPPGAERFLGGTRGTCCRQWGAPDTT